MICLLHAFVATLGPLPSLNNRRLRELLTARVIIVAGGLRASDNWVDIAVDPQLSHE